MENKKEPEVEENKQPKIPIYPRLIPVYPQPIKLSVSQKIIIISGMAL